MNHGGSGSRGRSQASGHMVYRLKIGSLVSVDKSLDESSGNRGGRGYRGRGRSTTSYPSRNSSWRGNDEHSPVQAYVQKFNAGFVDKGVQQTINLCRSSFVSREFEDKDVKDSTKMHCDLENRMKCVSLSCQESLSFTSDQNVEFSSVEDLNSAPKAGGAGNSSNESSTRPFDLFLKKKGIVLKPTQFELNRAKGQATKGYSGIVIRPGMVLLKNYLCINDQVMIVNKCHQLGLGEGGFYQPTYRDGNMMHLKMMCLGKHWDPKTCQFGKTRLVDGSSPPQIPVEFSQLVEKAIKEAQLLAASNSKETKGENRIPFMSPDVCIVNFYTSTGRLGLHQDKGESDKSLRKGLPIVSFSIGDSAEFLYGDQKDYDKAETLLLDSGDVLIFGGRSRKVFHGVRSIRKDTAPKALVHETSLRPGRLNLTFRQY